MTNKNTLLATKKITEINNKYLRFSKKNILGFTGNTFTYIMLISLSVIFLAPFFYMIGRSVMSAQDLADINIVWLPRSFVFRNYTQAFTVLNYVDRLIWSLFIAGTAVVGQIISCSFVGYGLARIKFKGNGLAFALIIFAMLIPPQTIIMSQYLMFARAGFMNSVVPIISPSFFSLGLNGGLFVFLFRQFYKNMPHELENAALIDGTGIFGAYFRIMLPNASSTILVTVILSFIWQWNNYFEPTIYINELNKYTLVMMLKNLGTTAASQFKINSFNNGINLAATFLCALPIIVLFLVLQRKFIKGIETSGLAN